MPNTLHLQQPEQTGIAILGQNEEPASLLDFVPKTVQQEIAIIT